MGENPDKYDYRKAQVKSLQSKLFTCIPLNTSRTFIYKSISFNSILHTCATQGPWPSNGRDWIQTVGEEKGTKGVEKTARKGTKGGKEETRAGGRGKEEVCISDWPWKGELGLYNVWYPSFFFKHSENVNRFLFFLIIASSGSREEVRRASGWNWSRPL